MAIFGRLSFGLTATSLAPVSAGLACCSLLDTIVTAFRAGATAKEIAQKFPTVALADVYHVIAYNLNHSAEVDAYLSQRQVEAAVLQKEIEQLSAHCQDSRGVRNFR